LPLLLLAAAFVFLIWMPMRTRSRVTRQTQEMQQSLTVGTDVMTTSGVYGRITALRDETVDLQIAPGVVVTWARQAIGQVRGGQSAEGWGEGPTEAVGE